MSTDFDVIVIGAGMVGAAQAVLLADIGLRVALLERRPLAPFDPTEIDLRVSAISCGTANILRSVGAWDGIDPRRRCAYQAMQVWDAQAAAESGVGHIAFDSARLGARELGFIIENGIVRNALLQAAGQGMRVTTLAPVEVTAVETRGGAAVSLADGRTLRAGLVVAADGAASPTREMAGIDVTGRDYGQHGFVTRVRPQYDHRDTAWQRFLPTGPIALLPLAGGDCSIVWSTEPAHAEQLCAMAQDALGEALGEASDHVLGALQPVGPSGAFPLRMQYAQRYSAPRLALVGDAAHTVHPLAGQGANLGFSDAAALTEVIEDALGGDTRPDAVAATLGDAAVLRRYERWRKGENMAMLGALDSLKRLFGNAHPLLGFVRRAGLQAVNGFEPLKSVLARRAMGVGGDVPRRQRDPVSEAT